MRITRSKGLLLTLGCVGCLTVPALGEQWDFTWNSDCGGFMDCIYATCWCEGDWSDADSWFSVLLTPPPTSTKTALIEWSNESTTCPSNEADENWLQINISGDAVKTMLLRAKCCAFSCCPLSCYTAGNLRAAFTGGTLTVFSAFVISGQNGPVLVEVSGGAQIKTN